MKIVNKKKFIRSIIVLGLILIAMLIFVNKTFSKVDVAYKKIHVSSGDTLWNIAKEQKNNNEYFENKDIRDVVDEIKYANHLTSSNLEIGQELTIPII